MDGRGRRAKGQSGEREVIKLLLPVVNEVYAAHGMEPPELKRNTLQSDRGGHDIHGLDWLALEVKRCETLNLKAWWAQTLAQAKRHQEPVLFFRQSREAWKVMMWCRFTYRLPGDEQDEFPAVLTVDVFMRWFRIRLSNELARINK